MSTKYFTVSDMLQLIEKNNEIEEKSNHPEWYNSTFFKNRQRSVIEFMNIETFKSTPEPLFQSIESLLQSTESITKEPEKIIVEGWKIIENYSAQFLDHYDDLVLLECLIDKEQKMYEEREFPDFLFDGYELKEGDLFFIRLYRRNHEMKIQVHDDPKRLYQSDFPKRNFTDLTRNSKLFD